MARVHSHHLKMTDLHPQQRAFRTACYFVLTAIRIAHPAAVRVVTMSVPNLSAQHENFLTTIMNVHRTQRIRVKSNQRDLFAAVLVKWYLVNPVGLRTLPFPGICVDRHLACIGYSELLQLDEYRRTVRTNPGTMGRADRVSQVAAGRITPMLVLKLTLQYQDFLAASVLVCGKPAVRCIADKRRSARDFITHAIEHHAFDARYGRWDPNVLIRGNDRTFPEVST